MTQAQAGAQAQADFDFDFDFEGPTTAQSRSAASSCNRLIERAGALLLKGRWMAEGAMLFHMHDGGSDGG
jgi:hypothetical protein